MAVEDPREVFREIDASGTGTDTYEITFGNGESVVCEQQRFADPDIEKVEKMDRLFAESVLLDAQEHGGADVRDGTTVDLEGRRVIVDEDRLGFRVVWEPLHVDQDTLIAEKLVGYVVADEEAVR